MSRPSISVAFDPAQDLDREGSSIQFQQFRERCVDDDRSICSDRSKAGWELGIAFDADAVTLAKLSLEHSRAPGQPSWSR